MLSFSFHAMLPLLANKDEYLRIDKQVIGAGAGQLIGTIFQRLSIVNYAAVCLFVFYHAVAWSCVYLQRPTDASVTA